MKVLIDIRPLLHGARTGVEVYMINLIEQLLKSDEQNEYVLWANSRDDRSNNIPSFKGNVRVVYTRLPNRWLNASMSWFNWPRVDRWIGEECDMVLGLSPLPLGVSKKTLYVTVFHDLSFEHFPQAFSRLDRIYNKLIRRPQVIARKADRVITISEASRQDLMETYGLADDKVAVTLLAANNQLLPPTTEETEQVREKYRLPKRYILGLSTIEPRKNMIGLIKAYKLLKKRGEDIGLVIVGRTESSTFADAGVNLDDPEVVFPGFIDEEDKAAVLGGAAVFCFPSFLEGFGIPLLEAMQCGAPVVTSNISSMPEVVGEAGVLVDPYNTEDIARGIGEALRRSDELIKKGYEQAKEFDYKETAQQTLVVLENLAQ